jgi:hypothetical protein
MEDFMTMQSPPGRHRRRDEAATRIQWLAEEALRDPADIDEAAERRLRLLLTDAEHELAATQVMLREALSQTPWDAQKGRQAVARLATLLGHLQSTLPEDVTTE